MRTVYGSAEMPNGMCGFGYVDEGLPKEEALAKLKMEMQNNAALNAFLSTMPKEKRYQFVKEIVDSIMGDDQGLLPERKSIDQPPL